METNDVFATDEERRDFYLKEFALLCPDLCTPDRTKEDYLAILQREQKEILSFLRNVLDASFGADMDSLCKVTFSYLMCDGIEKEDRIQISKGMRSLFSLLFLLQQKADVTAGLYNLYCLHDANLKRLI